MNRSSAFLAAALLLATPGSAFAAEKAKAPFEVIVSSPEGAPVIDADVAISSATTVVPYSFAGKTDAALHQRKVCRRAYHAAARKRLHRTGGSGERHTR